MTAEGRTTVASDDGDDTNGLNSQESGTSPYATGGGGVSLERRVSVRYLAHLLRQTQLAELPEGAKVLTVSYQNPDHAGSCLA